MMNNEHKVFYLKWGSEVDEFYTKYTKKLKQFADKSISKKRHVGAIVVDLDDHKFYGGFNHIPNAPESYPQINTPEMANGQTNPYVYHAEEDAIFNMYNKKNSNRLLANNWAGTLRSDLTDNTKILFTTYSPCINCAKIIVQSSIEEVVIINTHEINYFQEVFDINGNVLNYSVETYLKENNVDIVYIDECPLFIDKIYN